MGRKKMEERGSKSLVFMNTPITSGCDDVVGFETHVEKLDAAIASGGQMIAVTSPFGAGKTSVIELLRERYKDDAEKRVIKVSMWSCLASAHNSGESKGNFADTTELHKDFVYQLISQIDRCRGVYVGRRLSQNYGLLKLQTSKRGYWICTLAALVMFIFGYVFPKKFGISLPLFGKHIAAVEWCMLFLAVALIAVVVTGAEIIFSSNKSEGNRKIDANEVMEFYRADVLQYRSRVSRFFNHIFRMKKNGCHYIVVIEDLDRTDDSSAVIRFLKELRKYYVPDDADGQARRYQNRVSFLVNVKPETQLCTDVKVAEYGHLYEKLFDYVLNLQTVNIDDRKTVLNGLLKQKEGDIRDLGLSWEGEILSIPGISWVIRGKKVGIREMKDRLNVAFTLFESLNKRFGGGVEFEKCAIVAYITTEFESDFCKTTDQAFQKLVNLYLKGGLAEKESGEVLEGRSDEYKKEICELIEARKIDNNYRMYFYNYPQGSSVLSVDERIVQGAILYGEAAGDLESSAAKVIGAQSSVIVDAFAERGKLGLRLPDTVFSTEKLYIEALKHDFPAVAEWIKALDYSSDGSSRTMERIRALLHFDAERCAYSAEKARSFIAVWEGKFSETALLQLRKLLCKEFPHEISWYRSLFFGVHNLATTEELEYLALGDAIGAVDAEDDAFSVEMVDYITERFAAEPDIELVKCDMQKFLEVADEKLESDKILSALLDYQEKVQQIVPKFEIRIVKGLSDRVGKDFEVLFKAYQSLINVVAESGLSEQTLGNIHGITEYAGYSPAVTEQMKKGKYWIDAVLQMLVRGEVVTFAEEAVISAIETHIVWLVKRKPDYFFAIRSLVLREPLSVLQRYSFLFDENRPVMTESELNILSAANVKIPDVLSLLPPALITSQEVPMLTAFFNKAKRASTDAYHILMFIAEIEEDTAQELFYALDFDQVKYRDMSAQRKNEVKAALAEILELDTLEGKIRFMNATRFLDSQWERQMLEDNDLIDDNTLQEDYVRAVKSSDPNKRVAKTTVQLLCSFDLIYAVPEHIYQEYFAFGSYKQYVSCRTRDQARFEPETGERGEILRPIYLEMMRSERYKETSDLMAQNKDYMRELMAEGQYKTVCPAKLKHFAGVLQSKECIEYVLGFAEAEPERALEYLTTIEGFANKETAAAFVDGVEKNIELLRSDKLYNHTHEKLLDGPLKAKYTRAKNKLCG